MSIGAIGSAIFTNQMTANVSSVQNAHNSRVDFQNMVAQAAVNEKDEKVLKVRPAEENHEVDPDREHEKNEADQETARADHDESEDEEKEEEFPVYKLDIKV
ncbi:hypothetical protein [Sulfurimonas sp.]|uniref:hypothetical protein n=1 Tax=Sulfurimonas sp. TaxID=2022749 RepID=UPI002B48AA9E|nr:hypothetical protein [Sulfurimonas sp.]